jgi:signal transduction histidine kinase
MTPRVDRAARTPPERRALQDALAWPIAATLLVGAGVVFFLPRVVPPRFLALAVGAVFALTTVSLVAILAFVVERWLRRHAAALAVDAERQVQAVGVSGLPGSTTNGALLPVASAFADAGARAALRSSEKDTSDYLAQLGADASTATLRALKRTRDTVANGSLSESARQGFAEVERMADALRRVTAAVPIPTHPVDVVDDVRAVVAALAAEGVASSLNTIIDTDHGMVLIDRSRLSDHLRDLLALARAASPAGSDVTLHVSRVFRANIEETPVRRTGDSRLTIVPRASGDALREWVQRAQPGAEVLSIVITDAGTIPDADQQQRAFDAFASPRPGDALGTILPTIRRTVLAAKGTVWIDGSREGGTAVHLLLPIASG